DLADFNASSEELSARRVDVRDHELQALDGARLHVREPAAQRDGAGRPWRGQLHEADLVADLVVVVGVEADLLGVEGLCSIDIRDRDLYELEAPVHAARQCTRLRARFVITRSNVSPRMGNEGRSRARRSASRAGA